MSGKMRLGAKQILAFCVTATVGAGAIPRHTPAAPQWIPVKDRVRESHVIVVAEIAKPARKRNTSAPGRFLVPLPLRVKEILKGKAPRKFTLPLLIEPRGYDNYLPAPPPPGVYILFLIREKKKQKKGSTKKTSLRPYAPQTFFFLKYNPRNMREVTLYLLK